MKKQQTLAMVAVTTAVLAGAGTITFADEVATNHSVNDVVLFSDDVVDDTIGDVVTPPSTDGNTGNETEPSVPNPPTNDEVGDTVDPDVPINPDTGGDTPEQPTEPTTPPSTDNGAGEDTSKPSEPEIGEDVTKPSEPSQPTTPNPPITEDAVNKDDQGNITVKPQVVAPNQTVVGTQNGQLLVQDASGNTRLAEASEFGGQKNENGTVSFKTADGKTVTLPETGESTLGVVVGLLIILAGFGLGFKDKLRALIDKIKAKSKK
ncbi:MAG: transposase [Bacillota bacterium]|uniref:transposase n=1 Tax=Streptococcus gallolyticus TaxID=315405 RepID=UPI00201AA976|nr:transposase [Streptococcus gallolyticus]MCL4889194.1 transposase [Streptococcus gallolyticus]MDO5347297.1 transposase [Bacillota bacterium]